MFIISFAATVVSPEQLTDAKRPDIADIMKMGLPILEYEEKNRASPDSQSLIQDTSRSYLIFCSLIGLGYFEDLCRFNILIVISCLGSRRYPISEIEITRPGVLPSCSASQELNFYTTPAPLFDLQYLLFDIGGDYRD